MSSSDFRSRSTKGLTPRFILVPLPCIYERPLNRFGPFGIHLAPLLPHAHLAAEIRLNARHRLAARTVRPEPGGRGPVLDVRMNGRARVNDVFLDGRFWRGRWVERVE